MRALSSASLIVLLLAVAGCDKQSPAPKQPDAAALPAPTADAKIDRSHKGEAMPADGFSAPDGKPVTLAAFKGTPLLVNLWATWCAPCVKEMPALDRLAARTKGKLRVLVVNQDTTKQAVDPVPAFWTKARLANLDLHRDGDNNLGFAFGGGMLPTTILYDASGKEVWRVTGGFDWDGAAATTALAGFAH